MKTPKFAIASSTCFEYLTAGKKYEIIFIHGKSFNIIDNNGDNLICIKTGCSHLNGGNWKFTNK
jgi:hypothetical protein